MVQYPLKSADTAHRTLGEEAVVVNFRSSFFYHLNPVGTFIWEHCDGKHSVVQIATALTEEYQVTPEEAVQDCQQFIDGLVTEGLLQWRAALED
ncbi:MAG: PqqD family protein [Thermodesulfobacteriota bacterium]